MLAAIFLASQWHFLANKHAVLAGCSAFWPVNCIFLHIKMRARCTAEWPFCYWSLFCDCATEAPPGLISSKSPVYCAYCAFQIAHEHNALWYKQWFEIKFLHIYKFGLPLCSLARAIMLTNITVTCLLFIFTAMTMCYYLYRNHCAITSTDLRCGIKSLKMYIYTMHQIIARILSYMVNEFYLFIYLLTLCLKLDWKPQQLRPITAEPLHDK
jgi:hypothetical protein